MANQLLLLLFGIVTIGGAFLFFRFRKKTWKTQSDTIKLAHQNEKLSLENRELLNALQEYRNHQWDAVEAIDKFIEVEQNRIAHDLHDDTVQRLVLLRFRLEQLYLFDPGDKVMFEVDAAREEIDEIIRDIRYLIKGIPLAHSEAHGLTDMIMSLHERLKSVLVRKIELVVHNSEMEFSIDANVKMELFRIVQEAVQNALKHSIGWLISIELMWGNDLTIDVSDDGIGNWKKESGIGTSSMQQRASRIGAILRINNTSRGLHITVTFPKPRAIVFKPSH